VHTFSVPEHSSDIGPDEVHLWRASLDLDPLSTQRLEESLCAEELSRARRFIFPKDRDRFIAARGILRRLLAMYTQCPPGQLEFDYGPYGKPFLRRATSAPDIRFNLSHSHGLAVYAIGLSREVGIDVEFVRPDFAGDEIAQRYFSARELQELRGLPADSKAEGFFNAWTRKESYIKARGEGLHISLQSFDVSLTPGQPEKLTSPDDSRWDLRSFDVPADYLAAVTAEGKNWNMRSWEWKLS
jgi:4'-phosphopantetheinyl transferase